MKARILNISDIHLKNPNNILQQVQASLIKSVSSNTDKDFYEKLIVLITGDLTFSATKEQFNFVHHFIDKLSSSIKKQTYFKDVEVIAIPGNHDISINKNKNIESIRNELDDNDVKDSTINSELNLLYNFYDFLKKINNRLFKDNKCFCNYVVNFSDNDSIQFQLINSVLFSSLKHEDKDIHYIPIKTIDYTINSPIIISCSHHSLERFHESVKEALEKCVNKSSFFVYGHEHMSKKINDNDSLRFLCNQLKMNESECGGFQIFDIDFSNQKLEYFEFKRNKVITDISISKSSKYDLKMVSKYDNIANINYKYKYFDKEIDAHTLFVFPDIEKRLIEDKQETGKNTIFSFEEFINETKNEHIVRIRGGENCGKSSLLKELFLYYRRKGNFVVFVESLQPSKSYRFKDILYKVLKDNYNEVTLDTLESINIEERVIFIDDFDFSELENQSFIKQLQNYFGKIFFIDNSKLSSNPINDLNDIIDVYYHIKYFSFIKRRELINKILKYFDFSDNYELVYKIFESEMVNDSFYELTLPENIIFLTEDIVKNNRTASGKIKDSFSRIFVNNLENAVRNEFGDSLYSEVIEILPKIAYEMFKKDFKELYKISEEEITKIVINNNEEYGSHLESEKFINKLINIGIFSKKNNYICFDKNILYAYFVSEAISIKLPQKFNDDNLQEDINRLMDNIEYGNFSDILIFISFKIKDPSFFEVIKNKCLKITSSIDYFTFERDTKNYIVGKTFADKIKFNEKFEGRESHKKRMNLAEKKIISEGRNKKKEIFEDNQQDDILKVAKYMEILAKGTSGLHGVLRTTDRQRYVSFLEETSFKLVNKLFDFNERELEQAYEILVNKVINKTPKIKKEDLKIKLNNMMYDLMETFLLNFITQINQIMCSSISAEIMKKDIEHINDFNDFLFKMMFFERYGNTTLFYNHIKNNYKASFNSVQKNMIKRVFNLFLITTKLSNKSELQSICEKIDFNYNLALLQIGMSAAK